MSEGAKRDHGARRPDRGLTRRHPIPSSCQRGPAASSARPLVPATIASRGRVAVGSASESAAGGLRSATPRASHVAMQPARW